MVDSVRYKKKPLISVIMPVYNGKKYLDEAIQSVLGQTLKNFELILINDASTDNSLEIMKKHKKTDKRVVIINNKKNLGAADSRNEALNIAKGKYIALQDGDDISLPERLEKQYTFLENNHEVFMVVCLPAFINENTETNFFMNIAVYFLKIIYFFIKDFSFIGPRINLIINSSVMFRNTKEYLYRSKIYYSEDYDFTLQLLSQDRKMACINDCLVKYRISKNMLSVKNRVPQSFFSKKAQEFYFQRLNDGKDDYRNFNPKILLGEAKKHKYLLSPDMLFTFFLNQILRGK